MKMHIFLIDLAYGNFALLACFTVFGPHGLYQDFVSNVNLQTLLPLWDRSWTLAWEGVS